MPLMPNAPTTRCQVAHMLGKDDSAEEAAKGLLLTAGFSLYITIQHLLDFLSVAEAQAYLASFGDEARAYYARYVARLEIVNAVGDLVRHTGLENRTSSLPG